MLQLFPELLHDIFSYCDTSDLHNIACCSQAHNQLCRKLLWHTVRLPCKLIRKKTFPKDKRIKHLQHTKALYLHGDLNMERNLRTISDNLNLVFERCHLTRLDTWFLTSKVSDFLPQFHHLLQLTLTKYAANDNALQDISTLKNLTCLSVYDGSKNVTDKGVSKFGGLESLQKLEFDFSSMFLVENDLKDKSSLIGKVKWGWLSCQKLSDVGFVSISVLLTLQELNISYSSITDQGMVALGNLVYLKCLNMTCCVKVTDFGFSSLSNHLYLEELTIQYCQLITDLGLHHLSSVTSLRKLDLGECCEVSDNGLTALSLGLINLKELLLTHCYKISDVGLSKLCALMALEKLDVSSCLMLSTEGVNSLRKLVNLEYLNIKGILFLREVKLPQVKTLVK